MTTKYTILIVDDDPHIREVIRFALEQAGMNVLEATDGQAGIQAAKARPDLIILDIVMPHMDGLEMCRCLRRTSNTPILFLSSKDEEIDRVLGLELGGDDYLTKPFSPRELTARVKAILRRTAPEAQKPIASPPLVLGGLTLDPQAHVVSWNSADISLTAMEFGLLKMFLKHSRKAFTRDELMDGAYDQSVVVSDRTIDSHIRHIRQKFEQVGCKQIIETVHGVGYKLTVLER